MTVKVEMNIPDDAAKDVERLTDDLHMASRAETVIAAIRLMRAIVDNADGKGSRVFVTQPRSRRVTRVDLDPLFTAPRAQSASGG